MTIATRLKRLETAHLGRLGRLIMRYDHRGDEAALESHQAAVRAKEKEGFDVLNIECWHVYEGLNGAQGQEFSAP